MQASADRPASYTEPLNTSGEASINVNQLPPDQEAIVLSHLPIVRAIARRLHDRLPRHVSLEDLMSAGIIGLIDAASRYDPEKLVLFRSYAQHRIRGAILDSLRSLDWGPRQLRRRGREISVAVEKLTFEQGRAPTEVEVAGALNMSLSAYQRLLMQIRGLEVETLQDERGEARDGWDINCLPARAQDDPFYICSRSETRGRLADAIGKLPERQRMVMTLYYYEEMTMKEIGSILGVMECRISQIHSSALSSLRNLLLETNGKGKINGCVPVRVKGLSRPSSVNESLPLPSARRAIPGVRSTMAREGNSRVTPANR